MIRSHQGSDSWREEEVIVLFLLTDEQGRALLIAEAGSKVEADAFGCNHLPEFCGESVEMDPGTRFDAEEFWGIRTVRLVNVQLNPAARKRTVTAVAERPMPASTASHVWWLGPELPEDVVEAGLLTDEDHRDLTLDHIARTSTFIGRFTLRLNK